jgi:hypothetical protein
MRGMDAILLAIIVLPLATLGAFFASYKLNMALRLLLVVVAFFVAWAAVIAFVLATIKSP